MGKVSASAGVEARLDILLRLAAMNLVVGKSQRAQVWLLNRAGLQPGEIAALLGTSANTVSVTLNKLRKSGPAEIRKAVWAGKGGD